jgi:hypothetical protein
MEDEEIESWELEFRGEVQDLEQLYNLNNLHLLISEVGSNNCTTVLG